VLAGQVERAQGRISVDAAEAAVSSELGVQGASLSPEAEMARAERLAFHQQDRLHATASTVQDAKDVIGNPEAAVTARAESAAMGEAMRVSPVDVADVSATANVATATVRDPELAAQNRIEAELDAQRRDVEASVGIDASATVRRGPDDGDAT
jgi:hypothetical protein